MSSDLNAVVSSDGALQRISRFRWQIKWVPRTETCHSQSTTNCTHIKGWVIFWPPSFHRHNDCNRCEFVWNIEYDNVNLLGFSGNILYFMTVWMPVVVNAMIGGELRHFTDVFADWHSMQVIMTIRIYAMYQGSKKILVFLIVVLLLCTTAFAVIAAMGNTDASGCKF
jgi:hypothetical protein